MNEEPKPPPESTDPASATPEPSPAASPDAAGSGDTRIDGEITRLLGAWNSGDVHAFHNLMPLAYPQLRQIAGSYLSRERPGHTLQATALVNELYLRLIHQRKAEWKDRNHFFTFAAKLMRMILADYARNSQAQKRGGNVQHVPLSEDLPWLNMNGPEAIELDRALKELGSIDPRMVRVIELHHMLGCTAQETAEVLQVSKSTVDRDIRFVKAWLWRRLRAGGPEPES